MASSTVRNPRPRWLPGFLALVLFECGPELPSARDARGADTYPPNCVLQPGDRVAWVGSSSTRIGVWPHTMEFLLRTRHPGLRLEFQQFSTGGGTFQTCRENIERWLDEFHPTVVFLNYGGNDASAGEEGLDRFKENMEHCVAKVKARGARVVLMTPQAADRRKSGVAAAAKRTMYAETMLSYGRERGWTVVDIHHPLQSMQLANQEVDPDYTMLRDSIHLTPPAYVGWAFLLFDRLDLPFVRSSVSLTADGEVGVTENCQVRDVRSADGQLSFTRMDEVLPILPPGTLPPRYSVPLETHSRYLLKVTGLEPGEYDVLCLGRSIGRVTDLRLARGVNLNT
ncbi:MAG: GDSL-type esterase/lipase family protein, partial [Planctomycetia bacterium]|nr:GDSL-type esterase/lipase family protein [Planctomycetia bacterium]